jgi:predicted RNA-binding Zn-ribbon protein involved in translation (DUF1610 family)
MRAWSLSRLQSCGTCGHTWYPRGHWRSPKCPNCGTAFVQSSSSASGSSTGCLVVLAGLVGASMVVGFLGQVGTALGTGGVVGLLAAGAGAWVAVGVGKRRARLRLAEDQRLLANRQVAERFQNLVQRFGEQNANRIVAKTIWQGATAEMIQEMLGAPAAVSSRVFKTKKRDVWKYGPLDARRYALQVTLENDVCVGWETAGE